MMTEPAVEKKLSRRPVYWALLAFFAPLLLAFFIYYGTSWRPSSMSNKGDLVSPVVSLPEAALHKPDGSELDKQWLQHKWTLLYVGEGACDQSCRDALLITRNIRLLLGKDTTRVQRAFMFAGNCCDANFFSSEQPDLIIARVDDEIGRRTLKLFPNDAGDVLQTGKIYIIDPLGNLMMSYKRGAEAGDLHADLKKLLSLSHIG
jgi:cytochrome oxidase Cu insertion factor (SCO1/SenC/PrrC family)